MRQWDIHKQFRSSWDYGTLTNSSDPHETIGHLQTVQILMRLWDIYKQFRSSWDYGTFTNSSDPHETMGHLQTIRILMRLWDIYKQFRSSWNFETFVNSLDTHWDYTRFSQTLKGPRHEKTCFRWFANNKSANQPAHLRRLISAIGFRFLESVISKLVTGEISIFYLVPVAGENGLKLTWSQTSKTGFLKPNVCIINCMIKSAFQSFMSLPTPDIIIALAWLNTFFLKLNFSAWYRIYLKNKQTTRITRWYYDVAHGVATRERNVIYVCFSVKTSMMTGVYRIMTDFYTCHFNSHINILRGLFKYECK